MAKAGELTQKQEGFIRSFIETGNASEAYRQNYNCGKMKAETIHVKASELLSNGKVAVRVEELKADHADRHEIKVDDLIAELDEARRHALNSAAGASAAVAATMGKAKILGLITDKNEHTGKDGAPLLQPVINVTTA